MTLAYLGKLVGKFVEVERPYEPSRPLLGLDESYNNPFTIK
jgi:hypothetical protein